MPTVLVDGQEIEIDADERLNCIEVARRAGVEIPHYCWHPGLSVVASCRMCLIQAGTRNAETGDVSMVPKLVPGCQTPVKDGTVIVTNSEVVRESRARIEEALLIDHPIDCPICDKAGECLLQDYHFEHGQSERRADIHPFSSRRRDVGPTVTLFVDRCIMCTRCVRFTREVSGTAELMVSARGAKEEIDTFPGFPLDNKLSGNVVDLCPVGALGDKDFLYQQRVWFLKKTENVCGGCATGCSIVTEHNQDTVYRLKPRENPHINKWWMCDEGRYGWHHLHDATRIVEVSHRNHAHWNTVEWTSALGQLSKDLNDAGRLGVAVSPMLTIEEAWMLCAVARSIDPDAYLAMGHVPSTGHDESFPGGFTIRGEKSPNRIGIEMILSMFGALTENSTVPEWEEFLEQIRTETVQSAWITAGYPTPETSWCDEESAAIFDNMNCLVVQDLFRSPLSKRATWCLPAAGFAERNGTWVNCGHRAQTFEQAIRPPAGVWPEGRVFWSLLGRQGLYDPESIRETIAKNSVGFAALSGDMPSLGVDLRLQQVTGT
ncbi:MAG: 2Fe-2S iron-sulfur cluster binding domain-containing protein [Planctomycetaceae bacterium]|nr:2Fe-2S iron-sulfur cluster binding domain-containing protein [Planctomycetaceae bacterium]